MSVSRPLAAIASFAISASIAGACSIPPPETPGRCDPSNNNCPEGYVCCSDDPAALDLDDLDAIVTPEYEGRGGEGAPIFSGINNELSTWGACVQEGSVPPQGALVDDGVQGCPVPCNPTWSADDIQEICGPDTVCCQTVELELDDCVFDSTVGESGCWRPVTGHDIQGLGGAGLTAWHAQDHATHQDPGRSKCGEFVAGVPESLLDSHGLTQMELLQACLGRLTVANQRGFCLGGAGVSACPLAQASHRDACEQQNDAESRVGCESVEFP